MQIIERGSAHGDGRAGRTFVDSDSDRLIVEGIFAVNFDSHPSWLT